MDCSLLALRVTVLAILCTNAYSYLQEYPSRSANDSRTPLYFGLVQSFGGDYNGRGGVAGVQVALDRINNDSTLLPGYSLHYTLTDSQCNRTVALDALFQQIIREPVKIALIGSGCSLATEPTAEVSHYYNITHISCVSSSTELVDKVRFKFYYQLLPTEADIAPAYYGVIKHYGWRHVELIVQNENLFTVTMDRLKVLLKTNNITFSERIFETTDSIAALGPNPFDSESRIFIIATYSVHARPLLCEAYHRGIQYPRYLLLTYAWYSPRWWIQEDPGLTCTAADRESVLPFSLAFLQFDFLQHLGLNLTSDTGITGSQYFDEEKAFLGVPPLNLTQLEYGQYCYDATWTLAYALNQTINDLKTDPTFQSEAREAAMLNDTFSLEDFRYDNNVVLRNIMKYIANTTFNGVTGSVSFQADGIRAVNTLRVMQLRSIENETSNGTYVDWVEIGQVLDSGQGHAFIYLEGKSDDTVWPNGLIPYDGVPVEEDVSVTLAVTVIFFILSSAGIVFAIVCLIFNFIFRNRKLVRLSSPNLNYLIGAGAIVLYVDIYLFVIPTTDPDVVAVLCNLTSWLTALGYSLCYGTILAKMWRVYYIFNNPTPKKKMTLKDWMLSIAVLILVVVDVSILVIFMAVEGSNGNLEAKRIPNRENEMDITGELGTVTLYYVYICNTKERDIFLGILYGYKALLTVVTLVLAFQTRKVKVKGLNDAKYIAAAIYITSIVLAVVMVSTYSLKEYINAFASVFCTGFFIGTTFILALVFVPKMVGLYQDPSGESIFSSKGALSTPGMPKVPPPTQVESRSDRETIAVLQRKLEELQTVISRNQKRGGEVEFSNFGEATPVDYSITGEISGTSTAF